MSEPSPTANEDENGAAVAAAPAAEDVSPQKVEEEKIDELEEVRPPIEEEEEKNGEKEEEEEEEENDNKGGDSDSEDEAQIARRRRKRRALELDEDDYDLLEDNQVTGFRRKEKKKRLQKKSAATIGEDDEDEDDGQDYQKKNEQDEKDAQKDEVADADEEDGGEKEQKQAEKDAEEKRKESAAERRLVDSDDEDSEQEMADFIVHDEGEERETEEERARRKAYNRAQRERGGARYDQVREAADIFGDISDLQKLFANRKRPGDEGYLGGESVPPDMLEEESQSEYETDDEDVDDFIVDDEEGGERPPREKKMRKVRKFKKRTGVTPTKSWAEFAFEPSVIKAQMLTATDDEIRNADWPERLSIENVQVPNLNAPRDFAKEATWICDRIMGVGSIRGTPTEAGELLLRGKMDYESVDDMDMRTYQLQNEGNGQLLDTERQNVLICIEWFLKMVRTQGYELEYLATNMRDDLHPLLRGKPEEARPPLIGDQVIIQRKARSFDVLQAVYDWDIAYVKLQNRKQKAIETLNKELEGNIDDQQRVGTIMRLQKLIASSKYDENVQDVESKMQLLLKDGTAALDANSTGGSRRPRRRTAYDMHVSKDVLELFKMASPAPEKVAMALDTTFAWGDAEGIFDVEDDATTEILPDASPEELAKHYLDQGYEDEEDVIKALIEVSATELASDPGIRQWVRFHYRQYALSTTKPTLLGNEQIDTFHPLAAVKRTVNKPFCHFSGIEFSMVAEGVRKGLLEFDAFLPDQEIDRLVQNLSNAYCSENVSEKAEQWNTIRRKVVDDAIKKKLIPQIAQRQLRNSY